MPYVTTKQSPMYHQITLDEILSGAQISDKPVRSNEFNTRTYYMKHIDELPFEKCAELFDILKAFNSKYKDLFEADRHSLYRTFYIPKRSGGLRKINAPEPPLYDALVELRNILFDKFNAMYHTSAFAYIKGRSTLDAVKRHQSNDSHWFLKVDFHDFFGSTTKDFVMATLSDIYPFSEIMKYEAGKTELSRALDLCFLDGGLPQGTPISPMLTNLIMIPIDFKLTKQLRNYKTMKNGKEYYITFCYTRYADDMLISAYSGFNPREIQEVIKSVLAEQGAPYTFKPEKTHYGSRAGSNWNLGVMLNKDNEITIGHQKKKYFRAMITNFSLDKINKKRWEPDDVRTLIGIISYYRMIEPEYIDKIINMNNAKFNIDLLSALKAELNFA